MPFFLLKVRASFCHQQFPLLWTVVFTYRLRHFDDVCLSSGKFSLSIEIVTAECVCSAKMKERLVMLTLYCLILGYSIVYISDDL